MLVRRLRWVVGVLVLVLLLLLLLVVVVVVVAVVNDIVFEDKRTPFGDPLLQQRTDEFVRTAQETKELVGARGTKGVMAKGD